MASGGEKFVMSEKRVGELRATLAENFKKLKRAYSDAVKPSSDSEAKTVANEWLNKMWVNVEGAKSEYNISDVPTTSVEYAANELLEPE